MLEQVQYGTAQECPECGDETVNVQGVDACPSCSWVQRTR